MFLSYLPLLTVLPDVLENLSSRCVVGLSCLLSTSTGISFLASPSSHSGSCLLAGCHLHIPILAHSAGLISCLESWEKLFLLYTSWAMILFRVEMSTNLYGWVSLFVVHIRSAMLVWWTSLHLHVRAASLIRHVRAASLFLWFALFNISRCLHTAIGISRCLWPLGLLIDHPTWLVNWSTRATS